MDLQSATAAELHRFLEASLRGTIWASRATLRTAQRVHAAVNGPASNLTGWEAGLCASLDEARRMGRLALDGAHLIHVALTRDPPPVDDGWEIIDDHHSSSEDEPTEINDGWDDNGALFDDEPLATGYTLAGGGSDGDSASDTDRPPSHHRVPSAPTPPQHNLHLPRDPPPSPPTPPQPIHQNPSTRTHPPEPRTVQIPARATRDLEAGRGGQTIPNPPRRRRPATPPINTNDPWRLRPRWRRRQQPTRPGQPAQHPPPVRGGRRKRTGKHARHSQAGEGPATGGRATGRREGRREGWTWWAPSRWRG